VGEGGRREASCEVSAAGSSSGDVGMGGGVRIGLRPLASGTESAWKNCGPPDWDLLTEWDLLTADSGGEGALRLAGLSSCLPSA